MNKKKPLQKLNAYKIAKKLPLFKKGPLNKIKEKRGIDLNINKINNFEKNI